MKAKNSADLRLSKCWRVVDAITRHRNHFAFGLKLFHHIRLDRGGLSPRTSTVLQVFGSRPASSKSLWDPFVRVCFQPIRSSAA